MRTGSRWSLRSVPDDEGAPKNTRSGFKQRLEIEFEHIRTSNRKECWKCEEKTHKNHRASACCDVDSVNWKAELSLTKMTFGCQEDDIPMRVASYTWKLFLCTVVHLEAPFSTLSISLPMGSDNAFARKKLTRWRFANMANICTIITIEFHSTTLWAPSMAWGALSRGFWLLI